MGLKREKLSADAFLAAMAYEFPGLALDDDGLEVNGGDLVEWICLNLPELKTNIIKNMIRESTISIGDKVGVFNA